MTLQRLFIALCLLVVTAFAGAQNMNPPTGVAQKQQQRKPTQKELEKARRQLEKQQAKDAKLKAESEQEKATEKDVVYLFGVGTNLNDSVVYITEVLPVRYLKLQKKTKFLPFRAEFSVQLQEYLEGTLGNTAETTCVFYDEKEKKAKKHWKKMCKRVQQNKEKALRVVDKAQFEFKKPGVGTIDNVAI